MQEKLLELLRLEIERDEKKKYLFSVEELFSQQIRSYFTELFFGRTENVGLIQSKI